MYEHLYIKIALVVFLGWLIIFYRRKDQRQEMFILSLFGGIAAPIQEYLWFWWDYWHPRALDFELLVADTIFAFAIVGIAAVVYETHVRVREVKSQTTHPYVFYSALLFAIFGLGIFRPLFNTIYAAVLSYILGWLVILYHRSDLLKSSLVAGAYMLGFMFIGYELLLFLYPGIFHAWWRLENLSGLFIFGIPLEECLWFFSLGLAAGPLYEMWKGIKFVEA